MLFTRMVIPVGYLLLERRRERLAVTQTAPPAPVPLVVVARVPAETTPAAVTEIKPPAPSPNGKATGPTVPKPDAPAPPPAEPAVVKPTPVPTGEGK